MPLYRWRGIDAQEQLHEGLLYAFSLDELQELLKKSRRGLMHAKVKKHNLLSRHQKDAFFSQLASLLSAHIPLYESLCIMSSSKVGEFRLLIDALARNIAQGAALTEILEKAGILDPLSRALVQVGESTGALGPLLQEVVSYRTEMAHAVYKIRGALRMPLLTLGFFFVVIAGLFIFVVPQYEYFFEQNRIPIPPITLWLIALSKHLTLKTLSSIGFALLVLIVGVRLAYSRKQGKALGDYLIDSLPLIGSLHASYQRVHALKVLGILLAQQIPLLTALEACEAMTFHEIYRKTFAQFKRSVERGESFSSAWNASCLHDPEIEGLLALGESSGRLSALMLHGSERIEKQLYVRLDLIIMYLNPFLLICLSLLIGCLIYGMYMPLIEMSAALSA